MPYNNTPIAPPKDISGQVSLPLARVQKIINADPERLHTSKNAAFAIALATEMFIQHLAQTTHNVVKAERKPRRNIQYRDVSSAVAKTDNLEFLTDVVPKTITMKELKKREETKKKAKETAEHEKKPKKALGNGKEGEASTSGGLRNGDVRDAFKAQTNGHSKDGEDATSTASAAGNEESEAMEVDQQEEEPREEAGRVLVEDSEPEDDAAAMQIEMEMRGPRHDSSPDVAPRRSSGFTAVNNGS
ncbi:unnamed protein product [Periconia digitata]|uniref:Transcription factor CBF/NF-Y/archaeal histone domain-containing protein n=1 Tax=Periconia digitata TaxID=1303443 RepID=A0A9W4XEF2_9PLEO|nr:unnamed protein product [Periconia digitata]